MPMEASNYSTENSVIKSFGPVTSDSLREIIAEFNREDDSTTRPSILKNLNVLGFSLFKHRMLAADQVRLVQRNGVPELAGHSGHFQRRIKIWSFWKPWTWFKAFRDDSSTIGIYSIKDITEKGHIGYGNRHVVIVGSTDCAKVNVEGENLLLPAGGYVIRTNNFTHIGNVAQSTSHIEHGDLLRIMPPPNTVAVYNIGSEQHIFPDEGSASNSTNKDQVGIINQNGILEIRNPNAKFITFLPTDLVNKNYPTKKEQFTYYTQDSVQVGVKLFVTYRIIDPKLAIRNLRPKEIDAHIENVTHIDMAKAGQKTCLQGIQSSSELKIDATEGTSESTNDSPPAYHQVYLSTWQESVKKQLEKDLREYGIQLVRLNIEEINILNKDLEKEMGKQAVGGAMAHAELSVFQTKNIVTIKQIERDLQVLQLQAQQTAATKLIEAENNKKVAELNRETTLINAKAEADALELLGAKLAANPNLLKYQVTKANCEAIEKTHIHTLFFADGKTSSLFNNQDTLLPNFVGTNSLTNS